MGKKHFTDEQIAFALSAGGVRHFGGRDHSQARHQRVDFLQMEEAVRRARHRRVATASNPGGGEHEAQAVGGRPEPRQEDAAGRALKKTLRPAVQRVLVREVQVAYRVAERRACRVQFGYPRLWVLLRREGWLVNKKLVYRLYCEEGLGIRRKKPRRRKSVQFRQARAPTGQTNESWSMDFVSDQLVGGQRFRLLTLVDNHSRESLAIEVGQRLTGDDVVRVLERVSAERGKPEDQPTAAKSRLNVWTA